MFDLTGAIFLHGADVEAFCDKWDLQPYTRPCATCGEPLTTSIPFTHGELRGLMAPKCKNGCHDSGRSKPPYCVVSAAASVPGDLSWIPRAAEANAPKNSRIRRMKKP